MLEPVKPLTTAGKPVFSGAASMNVAAGLGGVDHLLRGALADAFGLAVAPDIFGGRISLCRSSMLSQTAWPTRWLEMAIGLEAVAL